MFAPSVPAGDGASPVPPAGVSGETAVFVLVSLIGRPCVSKPHVSARSSSSFCCASTAVKVVLRAPMFDCVERTNSCASITSAVASSIVAIRTSTSEKPAALSDERDFANPIDVNPFGHAALHERDRGAGHVDYGPRQGAP